MFIGDPDEPVGLLERALAASVAATVNTNERSKKKKKSWFPQLPPIKTSHLLTSSYYCMYH